MSEPITESSGFSWSIIEINSELDAKIIFQQLASSSELMSGWVKMHNLLSGDLYRAQTISSHQSYQQLTLSEINIAAMSTNILIPHCHDALCISHGNCIIIALAHLAPSLCCCESVKSLQCPGMLSSGNFQDQHPTACLTFKAETF